MQLRRLGLDESTPVPAQALGVWLIVMPRRKVERPAMEVLEAMPQHRAVDVAQHTREDFDVQRIGLHRKEERVECRVVDAAQSDAIADDRRAFWGAVPNNVGRVEERALLQAAHRATRTVSCEDTLAKCRLV